MKGTVEKIRRIASRKRLCVLGQLLAVHSRKSTSVCCTDQIAGFVCRNVDLRQCKWLSTFLPGQEW